MAGLLDALIPGLTLPNPAAVGGTPTMLGAAPASPLAASAGKALPKDVTDFYAGIDADPKAAFREQFAPTAFTGSDGLVYHRMTRAGNGSEGDSSATQLEGYYAHRPGETNVGDLYNRYDASGGFVGTMKTEKGMGALQSLGMGIAAALSMGAGGAAIGALGGAADVGAGAGVSVGADAFEQIAAQNAASLAAPSLGADAFEQIATQNFAGSPSLTPVGADPFEQIATQNAATATPPIPTSETNPTDKRLADGTQTTPQSPTGSDSMLDTLTNSSVGKVLANPLVQLAASSILGHLAGGGSHGTSPAATVTATPPPSSMPTPLNNIFAQQQSIIDQLSRRGRASTILTIPR